MRNKIKWAKIEGYNGYYEVSNKGQVRSTSRSVPLITGGTRFYPGRTIKFSVSADGYRIVKLSFRGKVRTHYIHRLVAEAFIPRTDTILEVNHIDGRKSNNRVENLKWVTHAENMAHAQRLGLCGNAGAKHSQAREVTDCNTCEVYGTIREAASARGMKYTTLWNMLNGTRRNRTTLAFKCDECGET